MCVPASRINLVKPGEMMNSRDNLTSFPSVGARIRAARKQAGLSQQALADLLLVSRNTVVNWEAGRCATDYKTALKLCDVLGLSPEDLTLSGGSEVFRGKSEAGTASAIPRPAPSEPYPFDSGELRFLQLYRQLSPVGRRRAQIALEAQLNVMNRYGYTGYLVQEVADEKYFDDPFSADVKNMRVLERFIEE